MSFVGKTAILFLLLIGVASGHANDYGLKRASLTIRAVDEAGQPVEGADAGVTFHVLKSTGFPSGLMNVSGKTDKAGLYTAEGKGEPFLSGGAGGLQFYNSWTDDVLVEKTDGERWLPWNQTVTLMLRKKVNPVVLGAVKFKRYFVPTLRQPIGFDVEKADWTAPHGKGVHSDFIITTEYIQGATLLDSKVPVSVGFAHEGDGVVEVIVPKEKQRQEFFLPYEAPAEGYRPIFKVEPQSSDNTKFHFFRIRTEKDSTGKVIKALYGKIRFPWIVDWDREKHAAQLRISYHYNPVPNDRNLEWDPRRNVLKAVSAPGPQASEP